MKNCLIGIVVLALSGCAGGVSTGVEGDVDSQSLAVEKGNKKKGTKNWTMALYDERGTGHNTREKKIGADNAAQLELKWRFDESVAGFPVGPMHATPAVRNGNIYVGDQGGGFYAVSGDGELLWTYITRQPNPFLAQILAPTPTGGEPPPAAVGTPIISGAVLPKTRNLVLFGDMDGNLYALNRETGEEVWVTAANPHPLGGLIGNSMLMLEDRIIVGFSSIENNGLVLAPFGYQCCTHAGSVAAFDIDTGAELWRTYTVDQPLPLDPAFAPFQFGPSGADIWGQPTYDKDTNTIYVGTGQNFSPTALGGGSSMSDSILALDGDTGAIKWVYQATQNDIWVTGIDSPVLPEGIYLDVDFGDSPKIYHLDGVGKVVAAGQKNGEFHVVNAATGESVTRTQHIQMANQLGGFQNLGAMANGLIFQHGLDRIGPPVPSDGAPFWGTIMALSLDGTEQVWRYDEFGTPMIGGLSVANDVVYAVSPGAFPGLGLPEESALLALNANTGELLNRIVLDGRAVSSPVVSNGRVIATEGNTAVFELGADYSGGIVSFGLPDEEDSDSDSDSDSSDSDSDD